ncbi:hypothetical protein A2645_02185 [Candidatus Nomurabacteria bacterium RIFCSPHIGHO2_01_FULL_39_9]|uniref:Type IV secretion system coupling protein TraD DNA-binding domain-containing protein n=1 Tax=Candidatus Nomurabacteria bacterium RIFCSPHIGHO2_01_FULL_39_9 TaxID=1801735 RepID=A0A1F6UV24_9BACT|nr:MAG: hypothetical protein A2645_02185 [Candidatus Nomurabacteria bacterium RIFCSPHIGHO2_01_FULL_39_9]
MAGNDKINFFGETDFRGKRLRFGIKELDRAKHLYIIGKTGMGKSTMMENMAIQDIQNGEGLAVIDPHGSFADKMIDYVPEERIGDVIYFAPFDTGFPVSFNVMEDVGRDKRHLVASGLMSAFKKIWIDAWSARMEYILNNTLLALLEFPDATILGVNRMLSDKDYRKAVVDNIKDPSVKSFWKDEFAKYGDKYMQEAGAAIQNKVGQFTSNPLIRNIIGQPKSTFDFRRVMDEKKILIINLSKGQVGEQNASLLGGMLVTKIYLAAMSRADVPPETLRFLPSFYLYVDEFQSFANESFADILSEARKYKLALTIAHQYITQMEESVRDAVFGNVGSTVSFRVGPFDAEVLERAFAPTFTQEDLVNLSFIQIYLTLQINGIGSQPFSATTIGPFPKPKIIFRKEIIENSRKVFARPRDVVELEIEAWHNKNYAVPKEPKERGEFRESGELRVDKWDDQRPPARRTAPFRDRMPMRSYDQKPPSRIRIPEFKEAKEVQEMPQEKPVPLSVLKKKVPQTKNVLELRELLSKVTTKEEKPQAQIEHPKKEEKKEEKPQAEYVPPRIPKEVPKDVLQKILE